MSNRKINTEILRHGCTFEAYERDFRKYRAKYDDSERAGDDVIARYWRLGTEPLEAAKHHVNGRKRWG